jgi:hypothetical protein
VASTPQFRPPQRYCIAEVKGCAPAACAGRTIAFAETYRTSQDCTLAIDRQRCKTSVYEPLMRPADTIGLAAPSGAVP